LGSVWFVFVDSLFSIHFNYLEAQVYLGRSVLEMDVDRLFVLRECEDVVERNTLDFAGAPGITIRCHRWASGLPTLATTDLTPSKRCRAINRCLWRQKSQELHLHSMADFVCQLKSGSGSFFSFFIPTSRHPTSNCCCLRHPTSNSSGGSNDQAAVDVVLSPRTDGIIASKWEGHHFFLSSNAASRL